MSVRTARRLIALSVPIVTFASLEAWSQEVSWAVAGRDLHGTRYLPADEITRDNDLPASAKATPMSYPLRSGAQYVAVAVGGGDAWGSGDYVIAFRMP